MNIGWSFCIVTANGNDDTLEKSILSIINEFLYRDDYEIIVIGNSGLIDDFPEHPVKFYNDIKESVFKLDLTRKNLKRAIKKFDYKRLLYNNGPICIKKNYAANLAKFDKLCVLHDYVVLTKNWRAGFEAYGDDWQICMNKIQNKDGSRFSDWCSWDYPDIGVGLLPYDKNVDYMYISGTYFCVKNEFFRKNPLDESLFWGDGEDVEWSLRVRKLTKFNMNVNSTVTFSKLKSLKSAPYTDAWVKGTQQLLTILS